MKTADESHSSLRTPHSALLQPLWPEGASLKLIGLGGVGGIVARYGAMFTASLGDPVRFVMIEGDHFEPTNATRMFFRECGNKAEVTRADLLPHFSASNLSLIAIPEFVTPDNVERLIGEGDIVLLTVDNHATRKLVDDRCGQLENVCLISGGNDGTGPDSGGIVRRGTYGNAQIYLREGGRDRTPPLSHWHPEIARPSDRLPSDLSCTEQIVSMPQILFANLATASAMLNTLLLFLSRRTHYGELAFDIADGVMRPVTNLSPVP